MLQMPPTAYFTLTLDAKARIHVVSLKKAIPTYGGVTFHDNTEHWLAVKGVSLDELVTKALPLTAQCIKVAGDVEGEFQNNADNLDYQIRSKAELEPADWKDPKDAPVHDPQKTAVFKAEVPSAAGGKAEAPIVLCLALTIASDVIEGITWYAPPNTNPALFGSPTSGAKIVLDKAAVSDIPSGHFFYGETQAP